MLGFGMVGWMIYLTPKDQNRLLKKYCLNASSSEGCEQDYLFFLFVITF